MKNIFNRERSDNLDFVLLKVVHQLARSNQHSIQQLLNLRVLNLGLAQHLADEVNWTLHLLDSAFLLMFDDNGRANHMSSCHNV